MKSLMDTLSLSHKLSLKLSLTLSLSLSNYLSSCVFSPSHMEPAVFYLPLSSAHGFLCPAGSTDV